MSTWEVARCHHTALANCGNDAAGRELWDTLRGAREPDIGTACEAIVDTMPQECAAELLAGSVATAFAWRLFAEGDGLGYIAAQRTSSARRDAARCQWQQFEARAKRAQDLEHGLGWDLSHAWGFLDNPDCNVSVHEVAGIAKLAGRIVAGLRAAKARAVNGAPEEVYGVEQGNVVGRLLPSELVHLDEPTEILLLDRIQGRRALQYAVRGTTPAARGPLVVCMDESGSMHASRWRWAKASAIALMRLAHADKRSFGCVSFSTSVVERFYAPGQDGSLEIIRSFLDGGTNCALAVEAAGRLIARDPKARGADVVLVTDGVDGAHPEQRAAIKGLGATKLFTVAIECSIAESDPLRALAERYTHVSTLDSATAVEAMKGALA